jgi:DNA-binding MarR family transcriptional regulator
MVREVTDSVEVANRLRPVLLRIARELRREGQSLGVTAGQVSLLSAIEEGPGVTAVELAERERISAAAMSGQLGRLEEDGLIERTRATDRRRVGLSLTAEGSKLLKSVRKRRTTLLATRIEKLEPKERERLEKAIDALERLMDG